MTDGKHGDCRDEPGSGYFFLSCKDVFNGRLNYDRARQIAEMDFLDTDRRTQLEPHDVLITNSGTIGRLALVPDIELTRRTVFQKSVAILKPDRERVEPRFLCYALHSDIRRLIEFAGGTAQKNLLLRDLRDFEIPVPPLPVQRHIAGILSGYDDLIENCERRIRVLDEMARALYREWFVRRMVSKTAGEIHTAQFGDICELVRQPYVENAHKGLPLLDLSRLPSRSLAPYDVGRSDELTTSRIIFEEGDVLFGAIRCYLHKVVVAPFRGVTNTSVLVLRARNEHHHALCAITASENDTILWGEKHSTGTKMPVLNGPLFQTMPIPAPSAKLAARFEAVAGPWIRAISSLSRLGQSARAVRDLLLPRLVSGQLPVENAA